MDIEKYLSNLEKESRYGEIRIMKTKINSLTYKNGTLVGIETSDVEGIAIRVLNNNFSFVTTNSIHESDIKRAVERAIRISKMKEKRNVLLSHEKSVKDDYRVDEKKKIEDFQLEEKISLLSDIDKKLMENNLQMRILNIKDKIQEIEFANTEGTMIHGIIPNIYYFYYVGALENGNFEQVSREYGMTGGYEFVNEMNIMDRTVDESKKLLKILKAKKIPEGKMDVIVGPEVSGIVAHESSGHPMEADRVSGREGAQAGESFVKFDSLGKRVGSDVVNVIDDPTIEKSFGYMKYDFEGVKTRKKYLYKNGIINEFLLNREYAGMLGQESNGSARSSSWNLEPIIRMSNTYIEPGNYSLEEMIKDVKYGILMNSFTEWNIDDIRYNEKYVGREAYLIENGEIKDPVRRPVIETTTTKFYSSVDAVSKDLEFFAGTCGKGDPMQGVDVWMGGPYVRLRDMYIR
ncbi:MAG: TldD/PmbA family protein [Thermoplasmata archaeon]